jgi:hypothetical protein
MIGWKTAFVSMLGFLTLATASADQTTTAPEPTRIEITTSSVFTTTDGGRHGHSKGTSRLFEREWTCGPAGRELEFFVDPVPQNAWEWRLPVRVLQAPEGDLRLLDEAGMLRRAEEWRRQRDIPAEACGTTINAIIAFARIECDPNSILESLNRADVRAQDLRDGVALRIPDASQQQVVLRQVSQAGGVRRLSGVAALDPEILRLRKAEEDVAMGQTLGPGGPDLAAALRFRRALEAGGTVSVEAEVVDATGEVRLVTTTRSITAMPGAVARISEVVQILERHPPQP